MKDKKLVIVCIICALLTVAVIGLLVNYAECSKKFNQEVENYETLKEEVRKKLNGQSDYIAQLEKEKKELEIQVENLERENENLAEYLLDAQTEIDKLELENGRVAPYETMFWGLFQ